MTITIHEFTLPQSIFMMGAIFLFLGSFALISLYHRKRVCKNTTTAKVIDIVKKIRKGSKRGAVSYYPVFNYYANGENITVNHNVSPTPYKVGDTFEIFYNRGKPKQYYIEGKAGGNWVFILVGAIFIPIGILMLVAFYFILP